MVHQALLVGGLNGFQCLSPHGVVITLKLPHYWAVHCAIGMLSDFLLTSILFLGEGIISSHPVKAL